MMPSELNKLTAEDREALDRDLLLYGSCFIRRLPDGTVERVPAKGIVMTDERNLREDGQRWYEIGDIDQGENDE